MPRLPFCLSILASLLAVAPAAAQTPPPHPPPGPPGEPVFSLAQPNPRSAFYGADGEATTDANVAHLGNCYPDLSLRCRSELRFTQRAEVATRETTLYGDGSYVSGPVGYLPAGTWLVEARTRFVGEVDGAVEERTSAWVARPEPLIIGALGFEPGGNDPGGPDRLRAYSCDGEARLSAEVWDVDGDKVQLQFEARPLSEPFFGDADPAALLTAPLTVYGAPSESLRVRQSVTYVPAPGESLHHARARWVDSFDGPGPWSGEISFQVGGLDACRSASIRDRLDVSAGRVFDRPEWYADLLRGALVIPEQVPGPWPWPCPNCFPDGVTLLPAVLESSASGAPVLPSLEPDAVPALGYELELLGLLPAGSTSPVGTTDLHPFLGWSEPGSLAIEPPLPGPDEIFRSASELIAMSPTQRILLFEVENESVSAASGWVTLDLTVALADLPTGAELYSSAPGAGPDRTSALLSALASAAGPLAEKIQTLLDGPSEAGTSACCSASGAPGCSEPSTEAAVCGVDPYCCDVAWDSLCVDQVTSVAGELCAESAGSCCAASSAPGCADASVQSAVCGVDPYCCDVAWDSLCVDQVATVAGQSCSAAGGQ